MKHLPARGISCPMLPRTPAFWYAPRPTAFAHALRPLAALWSLGHAAAQARLAARARLPVLCVGGLVAGGSGKTPTAIALRALLGRGTFVTRGYGGRARRPLVVDPARHGFADVGDEALLLARAGPTIVAQDRAAGAALAPEGPVILDDGLHHPGLHKDVSLAVVDGAVGLGNGLTLPAGPLREGLRAALPRCQAFVIVGEDARGLAPVLAPHGPVFGASMRVEVPKGGPFLAFAGLGRPEKFRESLLAAGVPLAGFVPFPDHHRYSTGDIEKLRARGAPLLTTEKDAVRLPPGCADVCVARVALAFADPPAVRAFLTHSLPSR